MKAARPFGFVGRSAGKSGRQQRRCRLAGRFHHLRTQRAGKQQRGLGCAAEPALPGPVHRPRNRTALQHLPLLRSLRRAVYPDGPDRVTGWTEYLYVCGGSAGVGRRGCYNFLSCRGYQGDDRSFIW